MKTHITSIHEEQFSDNGRVLGIIVNHDNTLDTFDFKDTFPFTFQNEIYIIFETMSALMEYLINGNNNPKRAYVSEEDFDELYDAEYIHGKFSDMITWINDDDDEIDNKDETILT